MSKAVVEKQGSSALELLLHPVVILNLSDHFTRAKVSSPNPNPRVLGALLGIQSGRRLEIFNSFEIVFSFVDGHYVLDATYLRNKQEQMKKVFPKYEILGWYSTGADATLADLEIHQQIIPFNESPLYLLLDPTPKPGSRDLPVTIYETEVHMVNGAPQTLFSKASFKIETGEAERISVDHVAHITGTGAQEGSQFTAHLTGVHSAIKMLNMRVKLLMSYLQECQKNPSVADAALLRQIASLCNQLPAIDTSQFKDDFLREYNDGLLVSYLASITKSSNTVNELVDKYNATYDKHSRRARFF
jgi:COP9 signalosome complex subunit 6